jgi:predicted DCC family thiol-disulfide oxidoreductase YuxK
MTANHPFIETILRSHGVPPGGAILLFDGVCNLCNFWVRFVLARDKRELLRFASLQNEPGLTLRRDLFSLPPGRESVLLIAPTGCHAESRAILELVRLLPFPCPLFYSLRIVPAPLRDGIYRFIAKRRYRWFGRKESCPLPRPEEAHRFL